MRCEESKASVRLCWEMYKSTWEAAWAPERRVGTRKPLRNQYLRILRTKPVGTSPSRWPGHLGPEKTQKSQSRNRRTVEVGKDP